jgi:hypothetical protein
MQATATDHDRGRGTDVRSRSDAMEVHRRITSMYCASLPSDGEARNVRARRFADTLGKNEMGSFDERNKQHIGQQKQGDSQRPEEPAGPVAGHNEEQRQADDEGDDQQGVRSGGLGGQLDDDDDSEDAEQDEEK